MSETSITIIGSGINAYFFIKNLVNKNIKINLIDFTFNKKYNNKKFDNLSSPKIQIENFDENIDKFKELNCLLYNNFNTKWFSGRWVIKCLGWYNLCLLMKN